MIRLARAARVMSPAAWALTLLVRAYQLLLSPVLGGQCRFTPSCSTYALQALRAHGAMQGSGLAAWRVLRCNPWCQGGHDPVPPGRLCLPIPPEAV
jgi:putative membrane protein insertion efficiency factor